MLTSIEPCTQFAGCRNSRARVQGRPRYWILPTARMLDQDENQLDQTPTPTTPTMLALLPSRMRALQHRGWSDFPSEQLLSCPASKHVGSPPTWNCTSCVGSTPVQS